MTREEAIDIIKCLAWHTRPDEESIEQAIKVLERESCDDAISRQAVISVIYDRKSDFKNDFTQGFFADKIRDLPPVTPQQKIGRWIDTAEEYYKAINEKGGGVNENTPYFTDDIACSECLAKFSVIDNETQRFKCCPNCGVKMVEPQEGGDQE